MHHLRSGSRAATPSRCRWPARSGGGEGRPREKRDACSAGGAKAFFEQGDDLLSDPPHETQGWYSVYDADLSTKVVLRAFAEGLATYVPGG